MFPGRCLHGGRAFLRIDIAGRTGNVDEALPAKRGEMFDDGSGTRGIVEMDCGMAPRLAARVDEHSR